jgi:NAD(P)H-hydrate epimerase
MNGVVMGIGPGLGMELPSRIALESFLKNNICPVVIDADGLNIISKNKERLLPFIPKGSIITPHPKEFERLFGSTKDSIERSELAMAKAKEYSIYIVLKGHHTAICTPTGECYFNLNGNAGMATPGSGDVLTGIITGLLAQSYAPKDAALLGVYLHGLSGDIAAKKKSQESLIAGEIIKFLGKAFL